MKRCGRLHPASKPMAAFLLILTGTVLMGAGGLQKGTEEMEVTGKIYLMGNEPFTVLAIEGDDGKVYALLGEREREMRKLQGKRVTVRGMFSAERPRGAEAINVVFYSLVEEKQKRHEIGIK